MSFPSRSVLSTAARDPRMAVLACFALAVVTGIGWGLPGPDTWCVDSISPRSVGLGALVETYRTGHFHTYPPLQMALLTVLSLPWMLLAAVRAGTGTDALGAELLKPLYMTAIEITARTVAAAMATTLVWNTMRLWERLANRTVGALAGLVLVGNATLVYYGHTGNVDVPCLFWIVWALVEIDRVAAGEPRETQAMLLATCAVLTKDQGAAALILPALVYVALLPWFRSGPPWHRARLVRGTLLSVAAYALLSGALVNPSGFRRRMVFLFGPGSQTWAEYPKTPQGTLDLLRDALDNVARAGSWPLVALAAAGVLCVTACADRRARRLLPACAALSFTLLFNLGARRSDDRFVLPQSVFLLPYAAFALARLFGALRGRTGGRESRLLALSVTSAIAAVAYVEALVGTVSLDATLLTDPRYAAEAFLRALPAGTRIDVVGSTKYLPRLPGDLVARRPGVEPVSDRQTMSGVAEVVDPTMDPRPRNPDYIVLASELSNVEVTQPPRVPLGFALATYQDATSRLFLAHLLDGSLGYTRVFRARCALRWPLRCRRIHGSTGEDVWIYAPNPRPR